MLMSTLRPKADVIKWQRHREGGYRTTTRYVRAATSTHYPSRSGPHLKIDKFIYLAYHQPPPIIALLSLDDLSSSYTITMAQSELNESLTYLMAEVASFDPDDDAIPKILKYHKILNVTDMLAIDNAQYNGLKYKQGNQSKNAALFEMNRLFHLTNYVREVLKDGGTFDLENEVLIRARVTKAGFMIRSLVGVKIGDLAINLH